MMDSNNFKSNTGVGEREGRIFSSLVDERHYHFAHGIGRSGDLVEVQPKAAGSSLIYQLTNKLTAEAFRLTGLSKDLKCVVVPMATGMTIGFSLKALQLIESKQTPDETDSVVKKYVVWSRIDQKSCLKSIMSEGLVPIVVEPTVLPNGEMTTNLEEIERHLIEKNGQILCVISTTSCFAPRQPDLIDGIAELCSKYSVGHLVNNAYGLQCSSICKLINRAILKGRVDAIIQSTDKNFMVPVGGAIVASTNPKFLKLFSSTYPGRASTSPILDLFITLLSMGERGYKELLRHREEVLLPYFEQKLEEICNQFSLSLIPSKRNKISYAVSLTPLLNNSRIANCIDEQQLTFFGSMLFQRNISGCRVVVSNDTMSTKTTVIGGIPFVSWGAHKSNYPHSYFTVACAIGMQAQEIDLFSQRFVKTLKKFINSSNGRNASIVTSIPVQQLQVTSSAIVETAEVSGEESNDLNGQEASAT